MFSENNESKFKEFIGNSAPKIQRKKEKTRSENLVFNTIPAAGVEPARPNGHWILSSMNALFKSYILDLIGF